MVITGKVKKGLGEASFWVKKIEELFLEKTGIRLYPGTLNIKALKEIEIKNPDLIIEKEEYGGNERLYVKKCTVLNEKSYIIRTEKNSGKNGDHPLDLLEIISDVNFREKYGLKDENEIKITI